MVGRGCMGMLLLAQLQAAGLHPPPTQSGPSSPKQRRPLLAGMPMPRGELALLLNEAA